MVHLDLTVRRFPRIASARACHYSSLATVATDLTIPGFAPGDKDPDPDTLTQHVGPGRLFLSITVSHTREARHLCLCFADRYDKDVCRLGNLAEHSPPKYPIHLPLTRLR